MTTGQKWLSLLLLQAGLLAAAYGGGRYPEWKKLQLAEENLRKTQNDARHAMLLTRARAVLMEAALAARYGNYGMAFERVIRAQTAAQSLKLPLQKEFDELSSLLVAQKPDVLEKILQLADKIEPPARLVPPELMPGSTGTAGTALLPPPPPSRAAAAAAGARPRRCASVFARFGVAAGGISR